MGESADELETEMKDKIVGAEYDSHRSLMKNMAGSTSQPVLSPSSAIRIPVYDSQNQFKFGNRLQTMFQHNDIKQITPSIIAELTVGEEELEPFKSTYQAY